MKKKWQTRVILGLMVLSLTFCSGQDKGNRSSNQQKSQTTRVSEENQIDIDKLDIPERMKKAIKSGKIPKERVREFLARQKDNAPLVDIKAARQKAINSHLILNGTVEPQKTVEVYSRLEAYTLKIIREEGDYVKANDLLALLDDTEIKIRHQQAKLQLKESEINMKDAENNFKRNSELKETDLISEQDFQASEATYQKAKIAYENNLENFKNLELQLDYTRIRSPVAGYVTQRLIEVGDRVTASQHVYTVEDFSPLLIRVYVPTVDIINLKKGMPAEISTDILKERAYTGTITLINPRIDVQSGTVKVTIEVFDETQTLKPGMFVEVKITISENPRALVIPKKALVFEQNQTIVFIYQKGQVFQRQITTGISDGDDIEVLEGLEAGEKVVTVGVENLKDGMKVRLSGPGTGSR